VNKTAGIVRATWWLVAATAALILTGETAQVLPGTPQGGETLFRDKQCAVCHTIGGKGCKVGPELGRAHHVSLTQFAGLMWNHGFAMWARMKERGIEVPQLTGQEMADIVAYLYTSHYFDPVAGSSARGQQLVQTKGCVACHSVRGKGGKVAADFATSNVVGSPAALIAAMWNHSRPMEDQATKQGLKLPTLKGQELADMLAYLRSLTKASATRQTKALDRGDITQPMTRWRRRAISDLGCTPTMRSSSRPSRSTRSVGMLRTPNRAVVAGFSSTSSLPTRTRPARSAAISSMTGAIILHGPHHVAHMSSSTGSGERSTSAAKVASVTVTGLPSTARGALHRPHTGARPCASFSVGTRFIAPQAGQRSSFTSATRTHRCPNHLSPPE
jgi:mono/diheme cytochrome c family protein